MDLRLIIVCDMTNLQTEVLLKDWGIVETRLDRVLEIRLLINFYQEQGQEFEFHWQVVVYAACFDTRCRHVFKYIYVNKKAALSNI